MTYMTKSTSFFGCTLFDSISLNDKGANDETIVRSSLSVHFWFIGRDILFPVMLDTPYIDRRIMVLRLM